ncbi:hypothetical protein FACS18947_5180 [Bacteroidia bacterium]|nr:hypothetical protein FACS18947_5180 [Bacteroidia bacterium]
MDTKIETMTAEPNESAEPNEQIRQRKRLEKSWFWIALLPMSSLFLQLGTVTANFSGSTGFGEDLVMRFGFALVIIGLLFVPVLAKRVGIFVSFVRFRRFCLVTAAVGITAYSAFFLWLALTERTPPLGCVSLIYVSLLALSSLASCTLHRAVRMISVRQAGGFSGFMTVLYVAVFLVSSVFLVVFNRWIVFYFTEPILYAAPLIALVILLYRKNSGDSDGYVAPRTATYFSEALFGKFMVAAFLMLLVEMFHDGSYYGGGTYSTIFALWEQVATFIMPVVTGIVVIALIRKNRWFTAILAIVMLICFEQGLILFFNDNEQLAAVYAISSSLTLSCPLILAFLIPTVYSAQRRGSAIAVTGAISFWLSGTVLNTFITFVSDKLGNVVGLVLLVKPAVTFTLSLILIAYLFYLYGENNRVYVASLIAEFKAREIEDVHETVSAADMLEGLGLTPREREVCVLLLKSRTVRQISGELGLAFATVNGYYRSLYKKLGIGSKAELFMRFGHDEVETAPKTISGVRN